MSSKISECGLQRKKEKKLRQNQHNIKGFHIPHKTSPSSSSSSAGGLEGGWNEFDMNLELSKQNFIHFSIFYCMKFPSTYVSQKKLKNK